MCANLFLFGANSIPNTSSLRCLIACAIIEVIGLLLSVVSVVLCVNTSNMLAFSYDEASSSKVSVNVTTYIQFVTCVVLFLHFIGTILSVTNSLLAYRSLKRLNNKIDRRTYGLHSINMNHELPLFITRDKTRKYLS